MMLTQTVLGLVLLSQAAAAWVVPILALPGLIPAPGDEI